MATDSIQFVRAAEASDAGQAAARAAFGQPLGQLAAGYLGEGAWEPRGGYGHAQSPGCG